jgi:sulfate permease, SulP family
MHGTDNYKKRFFSRLPIIECLKGYRQEWLRADLAAGVTVAAFTIPEAMAYAGLAGLPPHAGLYASIAAPLLYCCFGTSRQLAVGPTSAVSILVASGLGVLALASPEQYAAFAALTALLVGLFSFAAYLLRLGFLVNFISESVLVGFSSGAALYIASTQLPKLFGLTGAHGEFLERLLFIGQHLTDTNLWAVGTGLAGIVLIFWGEHRFPRLPWALLMVLLSIAVAHPLDLATHGVHIVGDIPGGLPGFTLPTLTIEEVRLVVPIAFAAFVLAYIEGMSMARAYGSKHRYRVDANQELLALGIASVGAGLTHAYPVAGSFSRTALNDASGAKTQLSGGFSAALVALVVTFLPGLFSMLPEPTLAAVVLVAVRGLFKPQALRRLYRLRPVEFWVALAVLCGVLVLGILQGVLIGVVLSLLLVIGRASQTRITVLGRVPGRLQFTDLHENPENLSIPGLLILRIEECLFYANAESLRESIMVMVQESDPPVKSVVLDLEMTGELDIAGLEMLGELHRDLQDFGTNLHLSRLQEPARVLLDRSGLGAGIGLQNIHLRTLGAIAAYLNEIGVPFGESYDVLPDLILRVNEWVRARACNVDGEDHRALETIQLKLDEILRILKIAPHHQ